MNFSEKYNFRKKIVEEEIEKIFKSEKFESDELKEIMEYGVLNGGKRIRPILFLSGYELSGKDFKKAVGFACSLEFIHSYSLIHDDLPAMDNDDLRRGKPTCHVKFSHYGAILAGDALLNYAFENMLANKDRFESENLLTAMEIIAKASGNRGMCAGQMDDMGKTMENIGELKNMYKNKTGALLKASVLGGYALSGGDEKYFPTLEKFSDILGVLFQIKDDILDVTSTKEVLGKPIFSDEKNDKMTFVSEYGIEKCKEFLENYKNEAISLLNGLPYDTTFLREITEYTAERKN